MPFEINILGPEEKRKQELARQEQELRLQILKQQFAQGQPGYSLEAAGRLGRGLEESERNLQLRDELLSDMAKKRSNIAAAATPLPEQTAGPVMPEQAAISQTNRVLQAEDQMKLDRAAALAQREAMRKELETFTGTVPLPTGGTAAAGETSTIRRRFDDMAKLVRDYQERLNNAQSPEEAESLKAAYSMLEPIAKQQAKKDIEASRTIPGLEGFGKDEQSTNEMRKNIADFASASKNIDRLLDIASTGFDVKKYAEANQIKGVLRGQLRVPLTGPGPVSNYDTDLMNEMIANPYMPFSKEKLLALKGALARKIISSASVYGFKVNKIQDLINAGGEPEDFNQYITHTPTFNNEYEARKNGYVNGDIIIIKGKKYKLQ